jgi:hypothetical protein
VLFLLPFLAGAPVGKGEPSPVLDYPAQVTGLVASATQISWTPNEPAPAGYLVRTTTVSRTSWVASAPLGDLRADPFVLRADLPAGTVEVLVKALGPTGLESILGARIAVSLAGPGPVPGGAPWYFYPNIALKTPYDCDSTSDVVTAIGNIAFESRYIRITGNVGGFTVDRGGTEAHPLVIMMDPGDKPWDFTGRPVITNTVHVTKPWVWIFACRFRSPLYAAGQPYMADVPGIRPKADNLFVTGCEFDCAVGIRNTANDLPAHNVRIGFNHFTGTPRLNVDSADLNEGNIHMVSRNSLTAKQPDHQHIYWNLFTSPYSSPGVADENHCIYSGPGFKHPDDPAGDTRTTPHAVNMTNTVIERCYMYSRRKRSVYLKHGVKRVSFCDTNPLNASGDNTRLTSCETLRAVAVCVSNGEQGTSVDLDQSRRS